MLENSYSLGARKSGRVRVDGRDRGVGAGKPGIGGGDLKQLFCRGRKRRKSCCEKGRCF